MSWKKWIVALATIMVTTQFASASADRCGSNDCGFSLCDCDPCEGWSVYADWLYWRTRKCDLDYAISEDDEFFNKLHSVCLDWDSGVRLGVLKACGDVDFGIHYTYFSTCASSKVSTTLRPNAVPKAVIDGRIFRTRLGESLAETENGDITVASGKYDLDLNQVDVELGYALEVSDCLAARAFSGFRYASIDQSYKVRYIEEFNNGEDVDVVKYKNDMDFYGLYLGTKASYNVCDCLDFFGGFSWGIGAAEFDRRYRLASSIEGEAFKTGVNISDNCWKVVSVVDLNVGLTYHLSDCFCADWAFSVGYEFHNWLNTSDFLNLNTGDNEVDFSIDRHTENLGFDGLFVRVSVAF